MGRDIANGQREGGDGDETLHCKCGVWRRLLGMKVVLDGLICSWSTQ
jgi:hypothetical protein